MFTDNKNGLFFLDVIYLFEREREHEWGWEARDSGRGRQADFQLQGA